MKKFCIILDEEETVRVIPSKWLTPDRKAMFWPPLTKKSEINDAVMKSKDVSSEWKKYNITKYIKSNGTIFLLFCTENGFFFMLKT